MSVKSRVYSELNAGQQAFFMFWVLYGHTRHGIIQFYRENAYLLDIRFNEAIKKLLNLLAHI